jgi:hypothetical protein
MALTPLAVSYWVDITGSYREALYCTAALFVVGAGALAVTPRPMAGDHRRRGGTVDGSCAVTPVPMP